MGGSREGGIITALKNKERYGVDYYIQLGRKGGTTKKTRPHGFAYMKLHDPERLSVVGRKGGKKSKRRSVLRDKSVV